MRVIKILVTVGLAFLVVSCNGSDSKGSTGSQTIQSIIDSGVSQGLDGVVVYVIRNDGNESAYSSGVANRETVEPINSASLFKIASISKLYLAVTAAKLAAQGIISLEDTLSYWLPELSGRIENAENITIRNLLEHRSGIPDFDSQQGFSWEQAHTDIDITLEYALDLPADFLPDSQYGYSNTNYLLLGKILDEALGYNHTDYIRVNILDINGFFDTYTDVGQLDTDLLIHGYWNNIDRIDQNYLIPGGSMIANARDTAVFLHLLNNGQLLNSEEQLQYVYFYNHSGWLPGYQSIATHISEIDTTVVQFVNKTGSNSEILANEIYQRIVNKLREE